MTSRNDALFEFMEKPELAAMWPAAEPAFLWRRADRCIVWSNAAGVLLWQADSLASLLAGANTATRQPAYAQIDRLAYRLDHNRVQLERLRFYLDGRDLNLLCRCEWRNVGMERFLLVKAMLAVKGLQVPRDPTSHAGLLLRGYAGEAMAFSTEGMLLAATPGMRAIVQRSDDTVTTRLKALARSASSAEQTARLEIDGRTRYARAVIVPCADQSLVLIRLLAEDAQPKASGIDDLIERLQRFHLARPATPEEMGAPQADADVQAKAPAQEEAPESGTGGGAGASATASRNDADDSAAPSADAVEPPADDEIGAVSPASPADSDAGTDERDDRHEEALPAPGAPRLQPISGSPNVFRLTTGQAQLSELPKLQSSEHAAFRELARALGARLESDLENAVPPDYAMQSLSVTGTRDPSAQADAPFSPLPEAGELLTLIERVPIALLVFADGRPVFANRALLDMFRYPNATQLLALPGISGLLPQLASETGLYPARLVARRSDGEMFHVIARLRAISWRGERAMLLSMREPEQETAEQSTTLSGHLSAARVSLVTPSERPAAPAEDKPRTADLRIDDLDAALRLAADVTLFLDASGHVTSIHGNVEALLGRAETDLVGAPFASLFTAASQALANDYLDGLMQHGVARLLGESREVAVPGRAGSDIAMRLKMGIVGAGEQRRFLAVLLDIADWKRTEHELRAARKAAEDASSQKSEFLARVSHEIRTPLNSIIGFSEMMIEEGFAGVENERYRDYLRDIHDSGKLLMGVINDLLDLSKIEAGKLELDFTSVDVNEVMRMALAIMQPEAGRGKIILRSSLASDLPRVVADQRSLQQILLNLLSNAIKFTDPGGQVIVSTGIGDGGGIELRVRDTGVGMDKEQVAAALEPFRQIPRALPTRVRGTGLGLPLTRALVEANRALFDIDSTPGVGTLIQVTFPPPRVLGE